MGDKYSLYLNAMNFEEDIAKAARIVNEMIATSDVDAGKACGSLAYGYASGQNYSKAFYYAEQGSKFGDANSYRCLADLYYTGQGVTKNYDMSYEYLLKAKAAGDNVEDDIIELHKNARDRCGVRKKRQGCYIATCVYGSYDCPQVCTLRRYRDSILLSNWYGRLFVKLYYATSPMLVRLFGKRKWFRTFWKVWLDKKVARLNAAGIKNDQYYDRR